MMIAVIVALPIFLLVVNGPAFRQEPNQVVVREHADLGLGTPQPVVEKARKDLEFTWLVNPPIKKLPTSRRPADMWPQTQL
jgi:hypothetical protein